MEPMRAQTIQCYQQTKQREHMKILQRQHIIEERKEMLENQNLEREESIRRAQVWCTCPAVGVVSFYSLVIYYTDLPKQQAVYSL